MTEVTYVVPKTGEKVTVAEPLVGTALTEIATTLNGKIGAVNVEASGITGPKLGAETLRILAGTKYELKNFTKAEMEAGATVSATRLAIVVPKSPTSGVEVEGIKVFSGNNDPIFVPPGQKLKVTAPAEPYETSVLLL